MMPNNDFTVVVTAGRAYDLAVEKDVFSESDLDINVQAVDLATPGDIRHEIQDADAVINRFTVPYTEETIKSAPNLKVIGRGGIGVDSINCEAAAEQGIYVVNVPEYCQEEVSNHTIMFVLALQRDLFEYNEGLKNGTWNKRIGDVDIHRLQEQTLGLIGFGTIARHVASKAKSLGINVIAADPYISEDEMAELGVTKTSMDNLLHEADFVSLHVPLTDDTENMIGLEQFEKMKSSSYLINVSRGELVATEDLVTAIEEDLIAGAAIDVYNNEPQDNFEGNHPDFENPLTNYNEVITTPHIAWYSKEAAVKKHRTVASDVRRVLEGEEPRNPVNNPR